MQNQENIYEIEQQTKDEHIINTDPREQVQPEEENFRPYTEGYSGSERRDIWSEGEKLHAEPLGRNHKSVGWLLGLILLLCAAFIAGSISGAIINWLSWLVLTVLITAGAFACVLSWRVVTIPMPERRFYITEHARLVISNGLGKVAIRRGESNTITVNATKRASGLGVNPEQMQIFYDQRGDTLGISTKVHWNFLQFGLRSIHFEITVPANCDVQLDNGSGRIMVQGASGDIRLRTGNGGVEVYELQGEIDVRTGSGGIEASGLQGTINIHTGSGGIKLNELQGEIDVRTGSGRIESYGLRGQVLLKTGSGGVTLQRSLLAGESRVTTGSGGIAFDGELDPRGNSLLKTGSGRIVLKLPDDSAFSLNAKAGNGHIINEFGGREVGSSPRAQLKLRTGSGRIHIAKRGIY